ncbi:hypothetical protein [Oceanisphaera sp.]|uniref:hypothetical protein n=1 Tax=Oceanisphaera sp. TaxID=1929979 RepID=UPI003A936F2F
MKGKHSAQRRAPSETKGIRTGAVCFVVCRFSWHSRLSGILKTILLTQYRQLKRRTTGCGGLLFAFVGTALAVQYRAAISWCVIVSVLLRKTSQLKQASTGYGGFCRVPVLVKSIPPRTSARSKSGRILLPKIRRPYDWLCFSIILMTIRISVLCLISRFITPVSRFTAKDLQLIWVTARVGL